jgi:hypothetical protein
MRNWIFSFAFMRDFLFWIRFGYTQADFEFVKQANKKGMFTVENVKTMTDRQLKAAADMR